MDENVTLQEQLEQDVSPVILLNKFIVKPEDTDKFIKVFSAQQKCSNNSRVLSLLNCIAVQAIEPIAMLL